MNLKPLEILRRSEEIDDLEVKFRNVLSKESTLEEKDQLLNELKAMLNRLENDLP